MKEESAWLKMIRGFVTLPVWGLQYLVPRQQKLWIFGAWDGKRYSDNSRALYEYVLNHCKSIDAIWVTKEQRVYERLRDKGLPVVMTGTWKGIWTMMRAGRFFATKGVDDVSPLFLNGIKVCMLWHGMPLKMIGNDAMVFKRKNTLWKKIKTLARRILVPQEFIHYNTISTAPFFTPHLSTAFALDCHDIWEVGMPRNDRFFERIKENLVECLDQRWDYPLKILYMPTHRDACTAKGLSFNPFLQAGFDANALMACLENINAVLLYKGHFFDDTRSVMTACERLMVVTDDDYDDLYRFVKDVDILITDYSSIYFDFLLCRKPMILFPFDEEDYVAHSRPFYFDYKLMEAVRAYSWSELEDILLHARYKAPREEEVLRFNCYTDGNACNRLINRLVWNEA